MDKLSARGIAPLMHLPGRLSVEKRISEQFTSLYIVTLQMAHAMGTLSFWHLVVTTRQVGDGYSFGIQVVLNKVKDVMEDVLASYSLER